MGWARHWTSSTPPSSRASKAAAPTSAPAPSSRPWRDEVVQIVQVMDGLNRYHFMGDSELLAAWESASNVPVPVRTPKSPDSEGPPAGGEVRPAA